MKKEECCPQFKPNKWDNKTFTWKNKSFIKEEIPTLFHIPFPPMIGKKITKMWSLANKARKVSSKKEEVLVLFHDPSAFKSQILISVTGKVPDANNISLSGKFFSKVYDGKYNDIPKFIKDMNKYLEKNVDSRDYYIHYAYCPKCAKRFGKNYMILFAKIN